MYYQQGDVLITPGADIPKSAERSRMFRDGRAVLAEGEATGHAHVAKGPGVDLFEQGGQLWLSAPRGAIVTHEEHLPIEIGPGDYSIGRVRAYTHLKAYEDTAQAELRAYHDKLQQLQRLEEERRREGRYVEESFD